MSVHLTNARGERNGMKFIKTLLLEFIHCCNTWGTRKGYNNRMIFQEETMSIVQWFWRHVAHFLLWRVCFYAVFHYEPIPTCVVCRSSKSIDHIMYAPSIGAVKSETQLCKKKIIKSWLFLATEKKFTPHEHLVQQWVALQTYPQAYPHGMKSCKYNSLKKGKRFKRINSLKPN